MAEHPELIASNTWSYRGWRFFLREEGGFPAYHVHGPNSNGGRARKKTSTYSDAVAYIDGTVKS